MVSSASPQSFTGDCCLLNVEKRKDSAESSTWALSNFLREVNQSKENAPTSKTFPGESVVGIVFEVSDLSPL